MKSLVCLLALLVSTTSLYAEKNVDPRLTRERIICVVPIVGAGTFADPRRPLFAPRPGEQGPIEGFSWTATDDERLAIVEFVAGHPDALRSILTDARVTNAFRRGTDKKSDIETALKKLKRDFDLDKFAGGVR